MEQVCETCARWVPRDFREDWGDEGGWWCPAARCRVDYSSYPPCGKAKWELRETGKAEIDKIMSDELKPCPFCKNRSNIKLVEYRPNCSGAVVCGQCGARGPKKKNDHERGWKAKAIEAWNTRAERTCRMNHVLLYDEEAVDGIECDEYFYTEVHSLDDPLPERCPGCKAKVVG